MQDSPTPGASTPSSSPPAKPTISPLNRKNERNWPTELNIPSIGVKASFGKPVVQRWDRKLGEWVMDPPEATWEDLQKVYWWKQHVLPGPATGTAYVYGHACISTQCAFNNLHLVKVGALVRAYVGPLVATYQIVPINPHHPRSGVQSFEKTVQGIGSSVVYNYHVPGRLVLITCGYAGDGSSPFNWVAFAQLISVSPR